MYKSRQVKLIAARLGCRIVFSTEYSPEGKGKIERFWKTTADGFLDEARHAGFKTLDELNQAFWAWMEEYHQRKHRSTKMPPIARWEMAKETIRYPHAADVHDLFLWEETRLIKKTGTLSLAGNEYQVSETLIGTKVQVRYDPMDLAIVKVYRDDRFVELAAPYHLVAHTHKKATPRPKDEKYLPLASSRRLLQGRVGERRQQVGAEIARVTGDEQMAGRFTLDGWTRMVATELGRDLSPGEQTELAAFFTRYAPLPVRSVTETLRVVVERKGTDRHLSYYLGEIAHHLLGGTR